MLPLPDVLPILLQRTQPSSGIARTVKPSCTLTLVLARSLPSSLLLLSRAFTVTQPLGRGPRAVDVHSLRCSSSALPCCDCCALLRCDCCARVASSVYCPPLSWWPAGGLLQPDALRPHW